MSDIFLQSLNRNGCFEEFLYKLAMYFHNRKTFFSPSTQKDIGLDYLRKQRSD